MGYKTYGTPFCWFCSHPSAVFSAVPVWEWTRLARLVVALTCLWLRP
jgi:hypothetical protein